MMVFLSLITQEALAERHYGDPPPIREIRVTGVSYQLLNGPGAFTLSRGLNSRWRLSGGGAPGISARQITANVQARYFIMEDAFAPYLGAGVAYAYQFSPFGMLGAEWLSRGGFLLGAAYSVTYGQGGGLALEAGFFF